MMNKSTHNVLATDSRPILPRWVVMEVKPNTNDLTNNKVQHCNDGVTLEQREKRCYDDMKIQDFNQEYNNTKDDKNSIMSTVIGENAVIRSSVCLTDGLREPSQDRHKGIGVTTCSEADTFDLPSLEMDLVDQQSYYHLVRLYDNLLADLECGGTSIDLKDTDEKGVINQDTDGISSKYVISKRNAIEVDYPLVEVVGREYHHDDISWNDNLHSEVGLYNRKPSTTLTSVGGTGREYQYGRRTVTSRGVATDERSRQ